MTVRVLCGDAIERLRELPADSVHCVVTSPPYWGLRDYGTGTWEGGDPGCEHRKGFVERNDSRSTLAGTTTTQNHSQESWGDFCRKCGARRIDQQIGLEPTPEAWAAKLVEVFREVRRVLRPDGVCFVNVGDSYDAGTRASRDYSKTTKHGYWNNPNINNRSTAGLKHKDLVGQPWLLAFALRADGWWLRSEIIWSKPNPMPESVTDRPTKAHEQVFLLTRSARYFYDAEAVREGGIAVENRGGFHKAQLLVNGEGAKNDGFGERWQPTGSRNLRSVWQIATEPFPEAHFATFPTELARRCILAGTSAKGCCPVCGASWARVVEQSYENPGNRTTNGERSLENRAQTAGFAVRLERRSETLGWHPSCSCKSAPEYANPIPCTVLDPFGGSGTTGLVADQLGRDAVLIELSPDYAAMAERRITGARARRLLGDAPRDVPLPGQLSLLP